MYTINSVELIQSQLQITYLKIWPAIYTSRIGNDQHYKIFRKKTLFAMTYSKVGKSSVRKSS